MEKIIYKISRIRFFTSQNYDQAGRIGIRLEIVLILLFLFRIPYLFYSLPSLVYSVCLMCVIIADFTFAVKRNALALLIFEILFGLSIIISFIGIAWILYNLITQHVGDYELYLGIFAIIGEIICILILVGSIAISIYMRFLLKKIVKSHESIRNYAVAENVYTPKTKPASIFPELIPRTISNFSEHTPVFNAGSLNDEPKFIKPETQPLIPLKDPTSTSYHATEIDESPENTPVMYQSTQNITSLNLNSSPSEYTGLKEIIIDETEIPTDEGTQDPHEVVYLSLGQKTTN